MKKRILSIVLAVAMLFTGCANSSTNTSAEKEPDSVENGIIDFGRLDSLDYMKSVQDNFSAGLKEEYVNKDITVESVKAVYVSKEYLEELAYNSQSNIWFGYTLDEINESFKDTPYVFTLGDDGHTTVVPFQNKDDAFEKLIKKAAIGVAAAGVVIILVVVTCKYGGNSVIVKQVLTVSGKTVAKVSKDVIVDVASNVIGGYLKEKFNLPYDNQEPVNMGEIVWGAVVGEIADLAFSGVSDSE